MARENSMFESTVNSIVADTETSMPAAAPKESSKVPLAELANAACIATDGDTSEGAAKLINSLKNGYRDFYKEKAREVMFFWAQTQIGSARSRLRSQLANPPKGRMTVANQVVDSSSLKSAAAAWFGWPVLPGVMLGDAKREHLQAAAVAYMRDADTFAKRGKWLDAIARAMPDDDSKVSDVLNEGVIAQMACDFGVSDC